MAKKVWDAPIDKNIPWDGNNETGNLPVSGKSVETFLKDTLNEKIGVLHYDVTNNRYLAFADQQSLDEYLADPTLTDLVLGTFDAPFNYSAEITLTTPSYNAVFYGSTGNYIDFTFDVKNKQGASTGENVTVTYTFIRNATKKVFTETRRFGEAVHFNVDKYLGEGTNTVIVGVTGQTTLAATTVALSYQVVNLTIEDDIDVSTMYDLRGGAQVLEVGYTVSGYGTKVVEWYLDGVQLEYVKAEDEVVDVTATRTKYILLSNLSQGTHSLQIRAYTTINGEKFYTNTLYRDIIVYTGLNSDLIIAMAATIPVAHGILDAGESLALYDAVQYIPYTLRFGTYTATNASSTDVHVYIDGELQGTVGAKNGVENEFTVVTKTAGNKSLSLQSGDIRYDLAMVVSQTTMNLQEITQGLVLDFTALGKSNSTPDRDTWSGNGYTGTLTGFNWNSTSGWVNNRLEMSAGTTFALNLAPLAGNPTSTGRTIEIEWSTKNVTDDDEIICDLRDGNVGILITATKVSMTSADGVTVETEYKSDENVRVGFVINRASGTTNQRMSFIYANGIVSRGEKWASTDSYSSLKEIVFNATDKAQVSLKSIRVYNVALTADQMLNNFTLYRDTVADMMTVYDRNDVYEEGTTTFSPDKMMSRLPVMIVTGDIPTLENTSDKDTQIAVTIDYYNMQDASKSFRMVGAAMRPQGTSSMGYPKKNFRIYTRKLDGTILYDANGNIVEDKLYSFKDGAQPVDCWCLKADYAESSGTHNTGIARLWNEALMNAQVSITLGENNPHNVDSEYVLRTEAQKAALAAGYPYDVRTTIDGFPILLFYRPSMNDDVIFIGKYNFNNDKSTESVFGFTGIPNFDNSHMQCWEVLNNGNALALFTSVNGFDSGWSEAFESRYPDTKNPNTADLKAFCEWMVNVSEEDFSEQKWEHLDVFKMAAYWCYLMRHAGADQFVKNAMFTSEDGVKFYYILYDNDTINGLINTGRLRIKPTDDRQTVDATGSYVFAGHDSRLWNMLENDLEFMQIVSAVDNALYSAGISYANTIKIFDEEQADKWVERVYNQDAQYKYVGPYIEKGIDNLFMLQGKRDIHRRWWLAKRFSIYDAKFVSGTYKSQAFEFKCINGTPAGQQFSITAGYPLHYGYGINNVPRSFGIELGVGDTHTFTTEEVVNLGDPIRVYAAPNISTLDLSPMADKLAVVAVTNAYDEALGTKLTKLVLGNTSKPNLEVTEISGLKQATALEYLDVQGMTKITSVDLSNHVYFKTLKALGSGVSSVAFAKGAPVERLELPSAVRILTLEQLPYLTTANVVLENKANLVGMSIKNCPNLSNDFSFVYDWYANKTAEDSKCSLTMDNVVWENIDHSQLLQLFNLKLNGGALNLKGRITLPTASLEIIQAIEEIFDETVFDEDSELYIKVPSAVYMDAPVASINEGESATFVATVYPVIDGTMKYSLTNSRTGASIDENTGVLTTTENGLATSTLTVKATFTPADGSATLTDTASISIVKRIYPSSSSVTINGNSNPMNEPQVYTWSTTTANVNGNYIAEWTLSGDVTSVVEIASQDATQCTLRSLGAVTEMLDGTLTLVLKKVVDGSTVATATKTLQALMPGVFMTSTTNPEVMSCMYSAGLAANESYMTYDEAAAVTDSQLQSGTSYSTSIFYKYGQSIKHFDEFEYFTGITKVPDYCFSYNQNMARIKFPPQITSIGRDAFYRSAGWYSYLTSIVIPDGVTTIGYNAFSYTRLTSVIIPDSVTSIGNAFSYCSIQSVSIGKGLKTIPSGAFASCYSLKSIDIPSNVTQIQALAFEFCTQLAEIKGCSGITSIDVNAFKDAPSQTTLALSVPFGLFKQTNGITVTITSGSVGALLLGTKTFKTPTGVYFEDMTTSRDLLLSYTGGIEDLTDELKVGYMTLNITSNKSTAQFKVDYTDINSGEAVTTTVTGTGSHILPIKPATAITVTPITEYEGLIGNSATVSSASNSNSVTCNYQDKVDIYIQHIDGTLYTTDEWSSGGYNAGHANGVAVVHRNTSFVLRGNSLDKVAWGASVVVPEVPNYGRFSAEVLEQFNGFRYTKKIIEHLRGTTNGGVSGAPASEACQSYRFPTGLSGYLGSTGQWALVRQNISVINSALELIALTKITLNYTSEFWTSTQCTYNAAWNIKFDMNSNQNTSGVSTNGRSSQTKVMPFCPIFSEVTCTSLRIVADNVSGNARNTKITWYATVNVVEVTDGQLVEGEEFIGTATSDEFPQNTSYTDTVERTIYFTYMGVTATTTITQGVWVDSSYTVDLNDQWQESPTIANPDSTIYDGVYESFSNYHKGGGIAKMFINISEYDTFKLYVRSYGESSYDYVMVSQLDKDLDHNTLDTNTTLVKYSTKSKQSSGTAISNYNLVEFTNINYGEHRITIIYRKDGSGDSGADRGYVLIPKEQ